MNHFRMILILFFLLSLGFNSFSQQMIGINGGINFPYQFNKVTSSSGNYEDSYKMNPSFHAGVISNFKLSKKISLQAALQASGKGSKYTYMAGTGSNIPAEQKFRLYYAELLLPLLYNIDINKNVFFAGAGPALAYGISGASENSFTSSRTDPFETFLKKFDAGVIFQSGIRIKSFQASVQYNYGLYNFMRNEYPWVQNGADVTWKNRTFSLSVAYFWKMKK